MVVSKCTFFLHALYTHIRPLSNWWFLSVLTHEQNLCGLAFRYLVAFEQHDENHTTDTVLLLIRFRHHSADTGLATFDLVEIVGGAYCNTYRHSLFHTEHENYFSTKDNY